MDLTAQVVQYFFESRLHIYSINGSVTHTKRYLTFPFSNCTNPEPEFGYLINSNSSNVFFINLKVWLTVFEINGALGARRAHFRGRAHVFRRCAPDVRTFFHPIVISIYQRSAQKNSRVHSFKMNAPEGRTK